MKYTNKMVRGIEAAALITIMLTPIVNIIQASYPSDAPPPPQTKVTLKCGPVPPVKGMETRGHVRGKLGKMVNGKFVASAGRDFNLNCAVPATPNDQFMLGMPIGDTTVQFKLEIGVGGQAFQACLKNGVALHTEAVANTFVCPIGPEKMPTNVIEWFVDNP